MSAGKNYTGGVQVSGVLSTLRSFFFLLIGLQSRCTSPSPNARSPAREHRLAYSCGPPHFGQQVYETDPWAVQQQGHVGV